ncbi:MAG: tRNA (adenosine(37)-N6)-threonylcarbamoyltransferase complex transferase subunit TsaD, partial [Pseudomonadota bacterium]
MSEQAVTVLGIETSCDETAAAVIRLNASRVDILSDVVRSQTDEHT